jgi:type VI secretion system protein ImpL
MKSILIKCLKVVFILALIALVVLGSFGLVLALDWPWWVGLFILLGLVGLWIAFLFFKKLWARKREQQFVQQIIEQDESQLKQLAERDRAEGKELQDRWKEAIDALKSSHLKRLGNPLYVLPWYCVIGESGCGKTTAIKSARLSSPFAEVTHVSGISGTRNCDWWFFEQAIIIDTAGRYTIRIDEQRDKDEWQRFLTLLSKYRQREPLNGLIVSIAADKLLEASPETLDADGRNVRRRIDELMRVLGAKSPVYVLVTKCDLTQGMTQFCNELPEKTLEQAMGYINQDLSKDVTSFVRQAFDKIGERLRDLRLLILQQTESKKADPALLLFPEEYEKLKMGLEPFLKAAFQENPYQETPIFRGLFFSSGRQEGTPYSHFLRTLGLIEEREVLPGTNKGLFLHDFFAKILPKDRALFAPTKRSLEWSRITRNLGLTAWIAIALALCGLLSFSFVKNLRALRWATHEFATRADFQGEIFSDMATLDRFRQIILKVEANNESWWIPRFWLNQSKEVEIKLKQYYCKQFEKSFLVAFDGQMTARMAGFSGATSDVVLGQHVVHLVRRINLIKGRLDWQDLGQLQKKPQPAYDVGLAVPQGSAAGQPRDLFGLLYLYDLIWQQDPSHLNVEMSTLQQWLERMLALRSYDLHFLVAWDNAQPSLSAVTLESFWGGSLPVGGDIKVQPAFTQKGKALIDALLGEMETAVLNPVSLTRPRAEFSERYRQEYRQAWYSFASAFPRGVERLDGRREWQPMAGKVAGDEGPYFAVLGRAASELQPLALDKDMPAWMKLVFELQVIKAQTAVGQMSQEKGMLGKVAEKSRRLMSEIGQTAGKVPGVSFESQVKAAQSYGEYQKALSTISPVSASPKLAFDITSEVYGQDEVTGQSPFFTASKAENNFKDLLTTGAGDEDPFWKLVRGPLDFLWTFMRRETACFLQKRWEDDVLGDIQGISDWQLVQQKVYSEDGLARKFTKGPAGPFLGRAAQGYYAKQVRGESIDFEPEFIPALNKGPGAVAANTAAAKAQADAEAKKAAADAGPKPSYTVTLHGLPTDVNAEAQLKPQAVKLALRCDSGIQRLDNYMYPCAANFKWSPETCSDIDLTIEFKNLVLRRSYDGSLAFAKFLRDFRGGDHTFDVRAFPEARSALVGLGIRYITVKYRFEGQQGAIVALLNPAPTPKEPQMVRVPIPTKIAKCWGR